ncbi:MAG: M16 family metallopeptidase [Myxococcota bacterium]
MTSPDSKKALATVLVAFLAAVPALAAPPLPKGVTRGATVEGITEYALSNGMKVLLFPDPSKATVTVNVTYFVGSRHEGYGETGMAHLLEHLLFKGTKKTPNVPQALVDHGAEPNGTTWLDRTNYFETMPATEKNLEWALSFEADRMVNSLVAKKDLDSEMTVVRNEYEMGETNPQRVLMQRVQATAYLWHNYGNPTIGARADIENVPTERLRAFYERYYQPDNAMLVVAGRFDEAKALRLIADSFGRLPKPKRVLPPLYTEEPVQDGDRTVTVRRVGGVQLLLAGYHVPAGTHEDFAAIDLLTLALGDTPSGRLYKALVETKKAASVAALNYQLKDPGLLMFLAEVRKDEALAPAESALLATVEEATKKPFTDEEVERARAALLKDIELTLNSSERVGLQLSEWAAMGDWRMLFIHRDRIRAVKKEDVQRVAAAYLKTSNRTLGRFVPTDAPDRIAMPPSPDVTALVKDYKGDAAMAVGEAFEATPKNIEARTTRQALPSGLEVALLPKKTRGETVHAQFTLRLGSDKTLAWKKTAAELTARMLMRGTKKRSRQQLKDELDRLKAQVHVDGGPTQVSVSIEARRPQLAEVVALVGEVLREPAFDGKEFEQLRTETLTRLESQKTEPIPLAQVALRRQVDPWPAGHPFYNPTFDESLAATKAVKLEEVKDFYARFYGAHAGELAMVGDFDAKELTAQLTSLFGAWKAKEPYQRIVRPFRPVEPKPVTIQTPDKANAAYFAATTFAMRDDHPDYPALVLADFLLGGGFLNSRLATRLRQKDGLSYGAGSYFRSSPLDEEAMLGCYAIYAPQNVAKVESAFQEELGKAVASGFTPEEVQKGKAGLLQQWEQSRAQDNELVRTLANYLFLDRTLAWDEALEKRVNTLDPKTVHAALSKHLDVKKLTVVKAGDFEKKEPPTR